MQHGCVLVSLRFVVGVRNCPLASCWQVDGRANGRPTSEYFPSEWLGGDVVGVWCWGGVGEWEAVVGSESGSWK